MKTQCDSELVRSDPDGRHRVETSNFFAVGSGLWLLFDKADDSGDDST